MTTAVSNLDINLVCSTSYILLFNPTPSVGKFSKRQALEAQKC